MTTKSETTVSNIVHNKAGFRALRELCGMSQKDVANRLDKTVDTIKKWESEKYTQEIPKEAWQFLEDAWTTIQRLARQAVSETLLQIRNGNVSSPVPVTYYRSQIQYNLVGRDEGEYGRVDALARLVAIRLEQEGVEVEMFYPEP